MDSLAVAELEKAQGLVLVCWLHTPECTLPLLAKRAQLRAAGRSDLLKAADSRRRRLNKHKRRAVQVSAAAD